MKRVAETYRTIFITGAARGLGRLLCEEFHRTGYGIIGSDLLTEGELDPDLREVFRAYYPFNLAKPEQIGPFVEQIMRDHPDIKIVINNAGILDFRFLQEYTETEILDKVMVNLVAPIYIIKNTMPFFMDHGHGIFINISSSSSMRGFETGTVYTATKAGINMLSESLNKEFRILQKKTGNRLRIHAVCPSRIATKEFLEENPGLDPLTLLHHRKVFRKIEKLIRSDTSGRIIPIMPLSLRMSILRKEIAKILST